MANYATVENNEITGIYDLLPANWKHISGLDKLSDDKDTLKQLGWYDVIKVTVDYDSALQYIKTYEWQYTDDKVFEIPILDDIVPETEELKQEKFAIALHEMRRTRDQLLRDSDWTELPSVQSIRSDNWKKNWSDYRQALREYPNRCISGDINIWNLVWPDRPSENQSQESNEIIPSTEENLVDNNVVEQNQTEETTNSEDPPVV